MTTCVCMSSNIYDEDGQKRLRGDIWDASQAFVDMVLQGDEEAGREPRLTVVEEPPKSKGRKVAKHEDQD